MDKTAIWLVAALVFYVLFKDKLFAAGGVSGGFSAGTNPHQGPAPGPSPTHTSYASTPPAPTNVWDVLESLGQSAAGVINGGNVHYQNGQVSF
jgi:hypothetical protein